MGIDSVRPDGGIDPLRASAVRAAGANMMVAGSAIFGKEDPAAAFRAIADAAEAGE